jgi:diacylglycerol kinase (ATP)
MPGIGIISNPKSKQNRKHPERMQNLAYLVGTKGEAKETRSFDDLYRVIEDFHRAKIDILGVNGGDGSLHVVITALFKVYQQDPLPMFAILRGGTLNTIANGLGVKGNPQSILSTLVEKYHADEPFITKRVKTVGAGGKYGFLFGNGIVYNFLEAYYATGNPSPAVGAQILARGVASVATGGPFGKQLMRRVKARVTVDGETWAQDDFLTIAAAGVPQIGLGFTPWYRYDEDPERIHVLGIHCSAASFAAQLPQVFRAKPLRRESVIDRLAKEIIIESEEKPGYMFDGDLYPNGEERLAVTCGPALQVIIE